MNSRIELLVELLEEGGALKVGDIRVGIQTPGILFVTGWTKYKSLSGLSQLEALGELENVKSIFRKMVDHSSSLRSFIKNKKIKYQLAFDYGQGAAGICYELGGLVVWETALNS